MLLQADLNRIIEWSKNWQLKLSPSKCQVLRVTNLRSREEFNYNVGNHSLENVTVVKDLGFYVTNTLKFSHHCKQIATKALKVAALIFRVFRTKSINTLLRAYKVYVRPIVESGSPVWMPYLCKDIDIIENVQRYFTRRIYYRCNIPM